MSAMRRPDRAYVVRFLAAVVAYVVLLPLCLRLARAMSSPARFIVVGLPVVAVAAGAWALWRYLREADEMQARGLLEALAFAVAGTVLVSFVYGMCQTVGAPPVSWVFVTPLLMAMFGVGTFFSWRKYR